MASLRQISQNVAELTAKIEQLNASMASNPQTGLIKAGQLDLLRQYTDQLSLAIRLQNEMAISMGKLSGAARRKPIAGDTVENVVGHPAGVDVKPLPPAAELTGYNASVANITKQLNDMGVTGQRATGILKELDAELRRLSAVSNQQKTFGLTGLETKTKTGNIAMTGFGESPLGAGLITKQTSAYKEQFDVLGRGQAASKAATAAESKAYRDLRLAAEAAAKAKMQAAAANEPRYGDAFAQAKKFGFGQEHLQGISGGGAGGIQELSFQKSDFSRGYEVIQRYKTTVTQLGESLPETQRKFRTFAGSIVRDIVELAKWTVAMAVIFGPIQAIGQLTEQLVENQVKLAMSTASVNSVFIDSEKIFNAAADAANFAGESVSDTITAFTVAYRATGGAGNESERFATANQLLADSLTLSKLAGMDETKAIDTLTAALRQSGLSLKDGTKLLDGWVRVTKIANVDLGTLATSFATMGDAADSAGISADQLNGIIATVASSTNMSGQEVANATRAIVSGFQSDKAVKELHKLGISTKDANGDLRDFMDIVDEIRIKTEKGIISPTQFTEATRAIGGGTRRQAVVSTFISSSADVAKVAKESAAAEGDAAKALGIMLDTAQTSVTKFGNALSELAMTMGTKGGLLDMFSSVTNAGTGFISMLNDLFALTGKTTPALLAMAAAAAIFYNKSALVRGNFLEGLRGGVRSGIDKPFGGTEQALIDSRLLAVTSGKPFTPGVGGKTPGQVVSNALFDKGLVNTAASAVLAAAIPMISNLSSGQKWGTEKAIGAGIGAAAGAAMGSAFGAPLIGATVGASAGEALISFMIQNVDKFAFGVKPTVTPPTEAGGTPDSKEALSQLQDTLITSMKKSLGGGIGILGEAIVKLDTHRAKTALEAANEMLTKGDRAGIEKTFASGTERSKDLAMAGYALKDVLKMLPTKAGGTPGQFQIPNDEVLAGMVLSKLAAGTAAANQYTALTKGGIAGGLQAPAVSPFAARATTTGEENKEYIAQLVKSQMAQIKQETMLGKVTTSVAKSQMDLVSGFAARAPDLVAAFGEEFDKASNKITGTKDQYKAFIDIITYGSAESVDQLNAIKSTISDLEDQLSAATGQAKTDIQTQIDDWTALGVAVSKQAMEGVIVQRTKLPSISGDMSAPLKKEEFNQKVLPEAYSRAKEYFAQQGISEENMNIILKDTIDQFVEVLDDGGKVLYEAVQGFAGKFYDPKFIEEVKKEFLEAGKIESGKGIGFQEMQFDRATLDKLAAQSRSMGQDWQKRFGYQYQEESQVVVDKEGLAKPLKADFKILAMLLEKLVDQGQKQLEGMYNIPEGATFWVPLQAAYYNKIAGPAGPTETPQTTAPAELVPPVVPAVTPEVARGTKELEREKRLEKQEAAASPVTDLTDRFMKMLLQGIDALTGKYIKGGEPTDNQKKNLLKGIDREGKYITGRSTMDAVPPPTSFGRAGETGATPEVPALNTKLSLNVTHHTYLQLDSKTIAEAVNAYNGEHLLRTASATGTSTKDYVI